MIKIGVIDYGVGNVNSLNKSFKSIGFRSVKSDNAEVLEQSDVIVLPGVGSFAYAMDKLKKSKLDKFIVRESKKNKPIIGICLGMQLLTNCSEENGNHKGLGIIPGKIKQLKNSDFHIGWNNIEVCKKLTFVQKFNNHEFFFNHGFAYDGNNSNILSKTSYGNSSFAAAIIKKNTVGFQFHPEKSQKAGLQILKSTINFLINNK
ncbi:imidazole glycerol phosphate synthase subunit HisH [Gammaproteobacteria bacterium]|nr:imidazole glycerol phosphate synthase subunit HisH [Gammaproteobacteria bacterium]